MLVLPATVIQLAILAISIRLRWLDEFQALRFLRHNDSDEELL